MSSNIERLARRKRQTLLTFEAVDPAKMSPAKVRYELPGKRKQTSASSREAEDTESDDILSSTTKRVTSDRQSPPKLLPTPARSSQAQGRVHGSINRSNIQVVIHSSPTQTPQVTPKLDTTPSKTLDTIELDSSQDTSNEESTPTKTRSRKRPIPLVDTDSDEMFTGTKKPTRINTSIPKLPNKGKGSSSQPQKSIPFEELSEDEIALPTPKPRKNIFGSSQIPRSKRGRQTITLESDSESDLLISSPKRSQQVPFKPRRSIALKDSDEDIKISPSKRRRSQLDTDSDNDSDEISRPSPSKRQRPQTETDEDEDLISPTKRRRNGRGKPVQSSDDDDDDNDDEMEEASPKRFTRQKKIKRHRTEKEKTLEILKRRRAGEVIEELTNSESETGEEESEEELQQLSEFEDDEEEPEHTRKLTKSSTRNPQEGDVIDDSDFVVEDDEAPLGVPDYSLSMPLAFTHAAHKPLKEHFRDVVEWMVKNKIFPAFPRNDEVYNQAFRKLDDESYGMAKSKFSSSQWTKDFTVALYARPHISFGPLAEGEGFDLVSGKSKCDACNHRNHHPSFAIQFEGKAYDKRTLIELDQGTEDDSTDADSDDSDAKSCDANGQAIPPEKTRWATGRICKANAELSHTLIHWKYSLNEWVNDTLEQQGYLTPKKLAERDKMKPKQLNKLANRLVDEWEAQGIIKGLYRDYKNQMAAASELTAQGRGGWK